LEFIWHPGAAWTSLGARDIPPDSLVGWGRGQRVPLRTTQSLCNRCLQHSISVPKTSWLPDSCFYCP